MNPHDEFTRKIIQTLDEEARQHPDQDMVLDHVMQAIRPRAAAKRHIWAFSGFALAAAITGISLAPNLLSQQPGTPSNQTVSNAKLSPQMIEDLEMLSLLGMENKKYGS
ncbi:hypothetical protein ACF3NA_03040 [Alkanindiges sp. WGS2144]|uniref:hypothetical protein n=1 Tax=Alkanindiges sp. WGS2144 TaxID=3366808 RepID=UPI0037524ECA